MVLTDGYTLAMKRCGCLACRTTLALLAAERARTGHQPVHLEGDPIVISRIEPAHGNPTHDATGTGRTFVRHATAYSG